MNDSLIKIFKDIMYSYNIKSSAMKLNEIDSNELGKSIFLLKSTKKINNIEYELLNKIKSLLIEIQTYEYENDYYRLNKHLTELQSYKDRQTSITTNKFMSTVQYLSSSAKESIVHSELFNDFNEYIHVKRPIEAELEKALLALNTKDKGIIFLVGSVGDGKSHLLSYFNKHKPHLLKDVKIYNDATESNNPYKTAVETLEQEFYNYERNINSKLIVAINIGMLHNLNEYLKANNIESDIINTIEQSNIFTTEGMVEKRYEKNDITIVSFLNEINYKISDGNIENFFIRGIFNKIFSKSLENPFYKTFIEDDGFNRREAVYQNFTILLLNDVQETVIYLLNKIQIENKRIISTRALLNFIYDIIVPEVNQKENDGILVNLIFNNHDKSSILNAISQHDPVLIQDGKIDQLNIELYNTLDLSERCVELFGEDNFKKINYYLYLLDGLSHKRKFEIILRLAYLLNFHEYEPSILKEYLQTLEKVNEDLRLKKSLLNKIINTIFEWKGYPIKGFIYNESFHPDMSLRIGLKFDPKIKDIRVTNKLTVLVTFEIQNNLYELEVDYNLFKLMDKVENGYILKAQDKQETVIFAEFVDNIINDLISVEETIITIPESNESYILREGLIGYEMERV